MKKQNLLVLTLAAIFALILLSMTGLSKPKAESPGAGPLLAHNVFFKLKDPSDANRKTLVEACHKFLSNHPGTVFYSAGTLASEFDREVNDRDFDVSLHVVFTDQAAHDAYQENPRHLEFIEKNRESWEKVRVFDSWVAKEQK